MKKKSIFKSILIISFVLLIAIMPISVYAYDITLGDTTKKADKIDKDTYNNIKTCDSHHVLKTFDILGRFVYIIKILVPVVLILVAVKGLAQVIIFDDKADLKPYITTFIKKFIIAVLVFFVPTILKYVISLAGSIYSGDANFTRCSNCLFDTSTCFSSPTFYLNDQLTYVVYNEDTDSELDCNSNTFFGSTEKGTDLAYYIQQGITIMKYVGIVLCIVLTVMDMFESILKEDKDLIRPLVQKTVSRVGYAVALVFLPELVEVVFMIVGLYSDCGIK